MNVKTLGLRRIGYSWHLKVFTSRLQSRKCTLSMERPSIRHHSGHPVPPNVMKHTYTVSPMCVLASLNHEETVT